LSNESAHLNFALDILVERHEQHRPLQGAAGGLASGDEQVEEDVPQVVPGHRPRVVGAAVDLVNQLCLFIVVKTNNFAHRRRGLVAPPPLVGREIVYVA
jgi:hypothetical protein